MWVKICANTNLEDAAQAAELGADAVGFVFANSKRQVTPAQVAVITPRLPAHVERVGVFSSRDASQITEAALEAGLTTIQLHGGLDEPLLEKLAGPMRIIQTLHWDMSDRYAAKNLNEQLLRIAAAQLGDRVLVDTKLGSNSGASDGGTGVAFDWATARAVFAAAPEGLTLIVAGGLRPENVSEAIRQLRPSGVDVASGVEANPGQKSRVRMAEFLSRAHENH